MGQFLCGLFSHKVRVNDKQYVVVKDIGEGAFSFVQLVRNGDECFALKRVLIQLPEHEEMVDREVKAHRLVDHPNVMPLIDYEVVKKGENTEARMLFPFYQGGSVQELIENSHARGQKIPEKKIIEMFRSLCDAVLTFHSHDPPYAHRDIKPHNLLLREDGLVCLMDMGSVAEARVNINSRSEAMSLEDRCAQECTAAFRAPELFNVPSECRIDERTDVWSLGCTLYAMAYGNSPCDGSALSAMSGRIRFPQDR
eukprot:Seg4602.1 transcript_id=Seg4602.1/GoldUCD/mRNA.D3Y31 product="Serine/threonine-protein kinase 16" protein_id=Seg4602.1/GoldUCD/D3Y31